MLNPELLEIPFKSPNFPVGLLLLKLCMCTGTEGRMRRKIRRRRGAPRLDHKQDQ